MGKEIHISTNTEFKELLTENALLRGIFEGASDSVYAKDLNGKYILINQKGAEYFQREIEEIIGKTDVDLVGEAAGRSIMDHDCVLFETEQPVSYDTRGTFEVGERYFSTSKSPFRDKTGKVIGLVGISRDVSQTRLAEAKYEFIFENAPIAFWEEDFSEVKIYLDGLKAKGVKDFFRHFKENIDSLEKCIDLIKVTNVNKSTEEMHCASGKRKSISHVGRNFTRESEKIFLEEFVALAEGVTSYQSEASIVDSNGEVLHVLFNLNVLPGHEETMSLVLISVVDVTESRTMASELSNIKHRYQSIVEEQTEMICRIDPIGKIQFRNFAFNRFFSFKDLGKDMRFSTLFPPAELQRCQRNLEALTVRTPAGIWEYRNFDNQGNLVWQEWSLTAFYGKSGTLLGYQAVGKDVTERKLAQEALEASEARWRSVIENADDIIMTVNSGGYIISVNQSRELPKDVKWTGKTLEEVMLIENASKAMKLVNKVFASGTPIKTEVKFHNRQGGYSTFGIALSPIFSGKRVITVICIARNISEIKALEMLSRDALIQGQENERTRVSRELHDGLGQLFTVIKLNLQDLRSSLKENSESAVWEKIEGLENNIGTAFSEVKNISKNLMPDVLKQFGLKPALQDLIDSMNASVDLSISLEIVDFENRFSPELEKALFRISQELVNNAIRHGKPTNIFVQLINHENSIVLMVEDDGIGFNLDKMTAGFGIRNVVSRADVFEGLVDIDSSPGKGTVITVEIPLSRAAVI